MTVDSRDQSEVLVLMSSPKFPTNANYCLVIDYKVEDIITGAGMTCFGFLVKYISFQLKVNKL